ncbi:MAG: hypothetical protein ACTSW1_09545 [Candidatus Hodarchaeales archaeon]
MHSQEEAFVFDPSHSIQPYLDYMNVVNYVNVFAKKAVSKLPFPPSYDKIRNINSGNKQSSHNEIIELEIGRYRCAIN